MGWPPAVVIVVRHGSRLDAADNQWHLTSPTPYDPPLTYGGWNQSKALGARIASILRTRETDDEALPAGSSEPSEQGSKRKRRHKVIIHTSPFLRCVQTSVGISAGLAQNPGHIAPSTRPSSSHSLRKAPLHSSPRMKPLTSSDLPTLPRIPEPPSVRQELSSNIKKSIIRVEAFLGEWLSPDYFEQITPPPSSIMMLAGAKADMLRREDYSSLTTTREIKPVVQGFPGGWGSPVMTAKKMDDEGPLSTLSSLAHVLPRRDRTSSLSSMGSNGVRPRGSSPNPAVGPLEHGIYLSPVLNYAISNSDPIPAGFVAHARDACVDIDYQWDSMREPLLWGNGGEYGEEWSSMHKRFRGGLQKMVSWYETSDSPGNLITRTPATEEDAHAEVEEEEDTDLVIILVTHGAGCNALIGALTNQPVLLDVGMASLTMAVRAPEPVDTPVTTPSTAPMSPSRRNSRNNIAVSDQYDVKLIANTEHLRSSTTSTPSSSRPPSLSGVSVSGSFRERFTPPNGLDGASGGKPPRSTTMNSNLGSIRRTASVATTTGGRSYVPSRQSSIGLWSAPAQEEPAAEAADEMILNFGSESTAGAASREDDSPAVPAEKDHDEVDAEPDDVAPLGLWGSPRPPGLAEKMREIGPKRRWTIDERERDQVF